MLRDYLLASDGLGGKYGSKAAIAELLEMHDRGSMDANLTLWSLLSAEIWYQDVFRRRSSTKLEQRAVYTGASN
jgi:hypothetical protein